MKESKNHTFAICAYKESEYLEKCIESIFNQTVKSNVIMTTSTPNSYIKDLASKYNIPLFINNGKKGIGEDWNFAVQQSKTKYVTVTHQDDIYNPEYLQKILEYKETCRDKEFIISFTKYNEIKNNEEIKLTSNLKIKELLLLPMKFFRRTRWVRKMCLAFGSCICCPSVTVNTEILGNKPYKTDMLCDLDWDSWLKFSKYKGNFLYVDKYLMKHRIHEESETSNLIENNIRLKEDYEMFCKFWPKFIAKILLKFYAKSLKTNEIN